MLGYGRRWDRAVQPFIEMFEEEGDSYLYHGGAGYAGIKVSTAERDAFIAAYRRGLRWLVGGVLIATFAAIGVILWLGESGRFPGAESWAVLIIAVPMCAAMVFGTRRLTRAPARALANRVPATAVRTRDEVRRKHFAKLGWKQILGIAIFGPILLWSQTDFDFDEPTDWLFAAFALFLLATTAYAALMKYRFGRS